MTTLSSRRVPPCLSGPETRGTRDKARRGTPSPPLIPRSRHRGHVSQRETPIIFGRKTTDAQKNSYKKKRAIFFFFFWATMEVGALINVVPPTVQLSQSRAYPVRDSSSRKPNKAVGARSNTVWCAQWRTPMVVRGEGGRRGAEIHLIAVIVIILFCDVLISNDYQRL